MIVDTSAVMAIALQEPGWEGLEEQAITAPELFMSCGTLQELLIVALLDTPRDKSTGILESKIFSRLGFDPTY